MSLAIFFKLTTAFFSKVWLVEKILVNGKKSRYSALLIMHVNATIVFNVEERGMRLKFVAELSQLHTLQGSAQKLSAQKIDRAPL